MVRGFPARPDILERMGRRRKRRHPIVRGTWTTEYGGMPLWGLAASVVVMLGLGAFALVASSQQVQAEYAREPRPVPTFSYVGDEEKSAPPTVLLVGDSYTYGSPMSGADFTGWPAAVGAAQGWTMAGYAEGGAGYVTPGAGGRTYGAQIEQAIADGVSPDLVIVEGGRNDRFVADQVPDAASAALQAVRRAWPDAQILVVGPIWTDREPGPEMFDIRDATRSAGDAVGAVFVDPLDARWFMDDAAVYVGEDRVHPNPDGQTYLGDLIVQSVAQAGFLAS